MFVVVIMVYKIIKGGAIVNSIFWMVLLLVPLYIWLDAEGNILDYFVYDMPKGQFFYIMSKLLGLYAFVFLWLHISYALLKNTLLSRFIIPWNVKQHQKLAIFSFFLICIHLLLFISAVSLRKETIAFDLLFPNFSHGSYKSLLSLGVIAFWLIIFVALMGRLKTVYQKNTSFLLWLHRLSYVCFVLIYVHGLGVGSETKSGVLFGFYVFIGFSFFVFLFLRIIHFFAPQFNSVQRNGI